MKGKNPLRWAFESSLAASVVAMGFFACQSQSTKSGMFQGIVEFDERVLGFETGGRVTQVNVRRGDVVRAGQVLATLDDTLERTSRDSREAEAIAARARSELLHAGSRTEDVRAMEAQVRAAEANESMFQKRYTREKALRAAGAVTPAQLDDTEGRLHAATADRQALQQRLAELRKGARQQELKNVEAQVAVATSAVKLSSERVDRHKLQALQEGTVLDIHVEPGEIVAIGSPVVTVADTKHPYTDVFVPEVNVTGIKEGRPARVRVDSVPEAIPGSVENIARRTEFTPRYLFSDRERPNLVVRVRVRIDDPKELLHAGVPAFVVIEAQ